jgi:cyclohexanone monooxygenase
MPAQNRPLAKSEIEYVHDHLAERRAILWTTRSGNSPEEASDTKAGDHTPAEQDAELRRRLEKGGFEPLFAYKDLFLSRAANEVVADFIRRNIHAIVKDPKVAEMLSPRDHPVGTKRPCLDTKYYETYNRPNVTLVDIRKNPITRITPQSIVADQDYPVDVIVFATGFDAMTGPLFKIDIRGKDGLSLREKWAAGPRTYLGLMTHGFPNLFTITGPGSPSVLSNMMMAIEQHVDWIADCIADLRTRGIAEVEANKDAEDAWVAQVNEIANMTLYPLANSWYLGANVPGKPRVFMPYCGGIGAYKIKCDEIARAGYAGFDLRR